MRPSSTPGVFVFLAIGVLAFLAITFLAQGRSVSVSVPVYSRWRSVFITVVASLTLLHWYDPLGDGKFGTVGHRRGPRRRRSRTISPACTSAGWPWTLAVLLFVLSGAAIISGLRILGWVVAALSVVAAVIGYTSHSDVVNVAKGIDHSFGAGVAAIGFLTIGAAAISMALSTVQVADSKGFLARVLGWRPGAAVGRPRRPRRCARSGLGDVVPRRGWTTPPSPTPTHCWPGRDWHPSPTPSCPGWDSRC